MRKLVERYEGLKSTPRQAESDAEQYETGGRGKMLIVNVAGAQLLLGLCLVARQTDR